MDDGTARTAGETWTMNGATLTIRTDTRWHVGAPAAMTGSIGSTTISSTLGGGLRIDNANVRWMPFNTGAGVVPAIGTTITQGGVSGYLLGVWSSLTSAPTTVGAAMPATGFLKFREVTGGNFTAGALTGITANATSADVTGWIEVVQDQAAANTVPRLGFFETTSDTGWFYLDNTTGVAGQIFQVPTNGGGVGTRVAGIEIETAPASGIFEKYTAVLSATFIVANLGTDKRSMVCEDLGGGQVRIGNNGTVNVGYLPPSGCRVRVPNIFLRQCTTGARASNAVPNATLGTRPDFTTTSAGVINIKNTLSDWYYFFDGAYSINLKNCFVFDMIYPSNIATRVQIDNCLTGNYNGTSICCQLQNLSLGADVTNSLFQRTEAVASGYAVYIINSVGVTLNNTIAGIITYARSSSSYAIAVINSFNTTITNCKAINQNIYGASSAGITVTNYDYCDRYVGVTNATTGISAIETINACSDIFVDGVTFGLNGTIANVHPYTAVLRNTACTNITFRNLGTAASPISGGSADQCGYIYLDSGANSNIRLQRLYITAVRARAYLFVNSTANVTIENVHCVGTSDIITSAINAITRGTRGTGNGVTGQASVYGTHCFDGFMSTTEGRVWVGFNEPTTLTTDQVSYTLGANAGFTSTGSCSMPNINDQVTFIFPYYILGHTALRNAAPTLTGTNTGNFSYEYQIDTGSGVFSAWKTLNGANLSAETISPTIGFKLKIRATCTVANANNALTFIRVTTNTTASDLQNALYPLDYATVTLTNLVANSRVQLYDYTNDIELYNEVVSGTALSYAVPYTADFEIRIRIMFQNGTNAYEFYEAFGDCTIDGFSLRVSQVIDEVYNTNAIDGSAITTVVIDDGTLLVEVDTGSISIQDIYAYETYWLYTEEGIRDEGRFIEAVDVANYKIFDFKIKNVSSPSNPLIITGGYPVDGDTGNIIDIIDNTGGTIFIAPPHVVAYQEGSGGLTAAEVWGYSPRTLTTTIPSATDNATAVREELSTELARIDSPISKALTVPKFLGLK